MSLRLDGDGPLHRRLERALRDAIRSGSLSTGTVLPPSRELAAQLGCSRWAVTQAYDQLVAEGYLGTRVGSGTSDADREQIYAGTARRFYRIDDHRLPTDVRVR